MRDILRHSFSKLNFNIESKNLTAIHKDSYNNFLYGDKNIGATIAGVLSSVSPINDSYGYASIEYVSHRFSEPKYSIQECRYKNLSYAVDLYVTFRLAIFNIDEKTKTRTIRTIKEQEILMCEFPLITDNSSFIVNGVERLVICQIHKAPGVFFNKKNKDNGTMEYLSTIIPYRGSRLEFSFSSKTTLNFRIDKHKKMPIYHLLSAIGMNKQDMVNEFYSPIELTKEKTGLYSFKTNLNDCIGSTLSINFRDEKGNIVLAKDTFITRLMVRKIKNIDTFYCNIDDLKNCYLYRDVEYKDGVLQVATQLTDKILDVIKENNVKNLAIVNENDKTFNECILVSINKDGMEYEQSLALLMKNIRPGNPFVLKDAEKNFNNIFFADAYYSLMEVGRYKLNQVLEIDVPESCTTLTRLDIVNAIKKLVLFKNGSITIDDVDSLSNRRIRSVGELVEMQFRAGVQKMAKYASEKLNSAILDTAVLSDFIVVNSVAKTVKDFFLLSELSQFMEQTNLLSELAHGRKISSLGSGGITRERASSEVRDIHITHYGRICPIETPDGQNIGLVTSLASYATLNKYGFIETPYRRVVDGVITDEVDYLDATTEKKYKIGQASREIFELDPKSDKMVSVRYNEDFTLVPRKELDYIDVSPYQITSMMASFVPFLESNDTARALMGCNMQRQAVPLLFSEAAFVATGVEKNIAKQSTAVVCAKRDGKVIYVDSKTMMVLPKVAGVTDSVDIYKLRTFEKTNNSTCINQKPIVSVNEEIKEGQIIADGSSTDHGEVALGKNLLVGFMPWRGYNYEDSVVISKRLVSEDKFTSIHIEEYEVAVRDTRLGAEEITRDISSASEQELRYLDETGIVHIGVNVSGGDILVGKLTPRSESFVTSEEKLLKAIFGDKVADKKDTSLRMPSGTFGTVVDVKILTRMGDIKDQRAQEIEREDIIKRTSQKDKELEIIEASFNDELDKLLSGVIVNIKGKKSKMLDEELKALSLHQKFAVSVADKDLMAKIADLKRIYSTAKSRIEKQFVADVSRISDGDSLPNGVLKIVKVYVAQKSRLQPGDKIAGRHGNKGVISTCLPVEDMPYMEDGTPLDLVFSCVSVPGRMNIGQILETHLGFLSYSIGKKIDNLLLEKSAAENVRKLLLDISTDKNFSNTITKASDDEIIEYGKNCTRGLYFATPVFDGCKIDDMNRLADKLGIDRSLQVKLYDGKTGEPFDRPVTVGYMYIIKLHHLVDDKMHARSTGPYSLVTQQPLGGKSYFGGQRLGEMECWALQAYGAAYTLQEMLTVKSDDVAGREKMYEAIINGETRFNSGLPESFNVLCREFRALGFDVELGIDG